MVVPSLLWTIVAVPSVGTAWGPIAACPLRRDIAWIVGEIGMLDQQHLESLTSRGFDE